MERQDGRDCKRETADRTCHSADSEKHAKAHLERIKEMRYIRLCDLNRQERKELNRIVRKQRKKRGMKDAEIREEATATGKTDLSKLPAFLFRHRSAQRMGHL